MSGHSKWATIKHKKGATDAKRGKMFTKLIKEITIAARDGGGDQDANARLRTAILKAKTSNMPKDNIERAIKKGTGELEGVDYSELTYEAYGPGGVAILINCLTDNKNRTAADIRAILTKYGGNLGEAGCVAYLFQRKGIISLDSEKYTEDEVIDTVLDAGADDVADDGGIFEVITEPESFGSVLQAIEQAGMEHQVAEISQVPDSSLALDDKATHKALRLIEKLDEHDDVQAVSSNLDIPDDFEFEDE